MCGSSAVAALSRHTVLRDIELAWLINLEEQKNAMKTI